MHGHQIRLLAEQEHVHLWTDISVGSLYQAIKRLDSEGLVQVVRTEREGNFPERQIFAITDTGRESLAVLQREGLQDIWRKPDPFDLALARLNPATLTELPTTLQTRLAELRTQREDILFHHAKAAPFLTVAEKHSMSHRLHHVDSEITWLQGVIAGVDEIIADESSRG